MSDEVPAMDGAASIKPIGNLINGSRRSPKKQGRLRKISWWLCLWILVTSTALLRGMVWSGTVILKSNTGELMRVDLNEVGDRGAVIFHPECRHCRELIPMWEAQLKEGALRSVGYWISIGDSLRTFSWRDSLGPVFEWYVLEGDRSDLGVVAENLPFIIGRDEHGRTSVYSGLREFLSRMGG